MELELVSVLEKPIAGQAHVCSMIAYDLFLLGDWTGKSTLDRSFHRRDAVPAHRVCMKLHLALTNIKGESSFP